MDEIRACLNTYTVSVKCVAQEMEVSKGTMRTAAKLLALETDSCVLCSYAIQ